jgi:hypothetical protein
MKSLKAKQQLLVLLGGLLLGTSVAWAETPYGDQVFGEAIACKVKPYKKSGTTKTGYNIQGSAKTSCSNIGSATAASTATIGPPVISASSISQGGAKVLGGSADATASSFDEAILTPPAGFKGNTVDVILDTGFAFTVKGAKGANYAMWFITWYVNGKKIHGVQGKTNGSGNLGTYPHFEVKKVGSQFYFTLEIVAGTDAGKKASASCSTAGIIVSLPQGWSSTWASDLDGYGHRSSSQPE